MNTDSTYDRVRLNFFKVGFGEVELATIDYILHSTKEIIIYKNKDKKHNKT